MPKVTKPGRAEQQWKEGGAGARGRTSRPPISIPTVFRTLPPPLFVLVSEFEKGADPREKRCQMIHQILAVSNNPQERSASDQRTSGTTSEELLERPLGVAGLEVEPLAAAALAEASAARKPAGSETREAAAAAAREAASSITTAVLQPLLPVLVIDAPLLGVGQDFIGLRNVGELLGGPLLLFLVLVRVVLER